MIPIKSTILTNFQSFLFDLGIKQGQVPSHLYKYRTVKQTVQILENPAVCFPSYKNLNDLFECMANIDYNVSEDDMQAYLERQGLISKAARALAKDIVSNPDKLRKTLDEAIEHVKSSVGLLCLSESPLIPTMWNLYGQEYEGACIEFDISKDPAAFYFPKAIEYVDDVVSYNYIHTQIGKDNKKKTTDSFFQKPTEWSKEQEWRVCKIGHADTLHPVNPQAISKIIFGPKATAKDISDIKALSSQKGYTHLTFEQIILSPTSKTFTTKTI